MADEAHQVHSNLQLAAAVVLAVGVCGGWFWQYASQSADAKTTSDRVTKLEAKSDKEPEVLGDMNARLVRIETKVDMLVTVRKAER